MHNIYIADEQTHPSIETNAANVSSVLTRTGVDLLVRVQINVHACLSCIVADLYLNFARGIRGF